jgi:3-deoxy-manno-octulosonate cytidylyltransferase (CMP-KDO synthetase)
MVAMTAVGIIPARWHASRFPGKPLAKIAGLPMIQRVYEGACGATRLRAVYVATDDQRIADACAGFGATAVMTSTDHPTGTDRLAEACRDLSDDIVVNIQGDEPLIEGFVIDAAVAALENNTEAPMSTVVHAADPDSVDDPNRVKVVLDRSGFALYFSRSRIPALRDRGSPPHYWQHVGLYAYRREFLMRYVDLTPGEAERAEALEQLRALEHGHRIRVAVIEGWHSTPVDTPEDVERVEALLASRDAARLSRRNP